MVGIRFLLGVNKGKEWMSKILCLKESVELHLPVKTLLDLYITEIHMVTEKCWWYWRISRKSESTAPIYFGICSMSRTATLLITSIIHRKFDRAYINPITLLDTANSSICKYPWGSWLLKSSSVFQPFFPQEPLLIMQCFPRLHILFSCTTSNQDLSHLNQ